MGAWNYQTTGSPAVISTNFNNYINGFIGIQPDQGILQDIGTLVGHQVNVYQQTFGANQLVFELQGETDKYNTWCTIRIMEQPKIG